MGSVAILPAFAPESDYILNFGDIEVNLDRNTVARKGHAVHLTPAEYELLTYFALNPGKELSRDMILDSVWSYLPSPNTRTVDAHVLRLRQKLERDSNAPCHFLTVYRVGYCFKP